MHAWSVLVGKTFVSGEASSLAQQEHLTSLMWDTDRTPPVHGSPPLTHTPPLSGAVLSGAVRLTWPPIIYPHTRHPSPLHPSPEHPSPSLGVVYDRLNRRIEPAIWSMPTIAYRCMSPDFIKWVLTNGRRTGLINLSRWHTLLPFLSDKLAQGTWWKYRRGRC